MTTPSRRLRLGSGGRFLVLFLVLGLTTTATPALAKKAPPGLSAIQHATVGDISMGYRTGGSGRPLVLIMGRSGTMTDWDPRLLRALMRQHFIVVFDNRAVATTSEVPNNTLSVEQMARDTAGLMDALGIGEADVLGWSMGGYIAQTLALNHPTKVRRLALAATSPGGPQTVPPLAFMQTILGSDDLSSAVLFALSFPPTKAAIKAAVAYLGRVERERAELEMMGVPPSSFTLDSTAKAEQLEAVEQWKSPQGGDWNRLPGLRSRTLVANGNLDLVERPINGRNLARRIPHARHCVFPDTGHAFLFQEPTLYARTVNLFLANRLLRKSTDRESRLRCRRG